MLKLLTEVESILAHLAQEVDHGASVTIQFMAGDWRRLKEAAKAARIAHEANQLTAQILTPPVVEPPVVEPPVVEPPVESSLA
jgi:hypothetical protein